ncbi:MAG: hypothetical protein Q8K92_07015 [Leadbetterella sp.]|nr:hypothetical protein [Leadbetterella sp.]
MKKLTSKKSRFKQNTKIAIAATMLAVPMLYSPTTLFAQEKKSTERILDVTFKFASLFMKYELHDVFITGIANNHTIYKNNKGEFFWVNPNNGDLKFLPKDWDKKEKYFTIKLSTKVSLLGVDSKGNVIQQNKKGEKFYLNQMNGDMVFVK